MFFEHVGMPGNDALRFVEDLHLPWSKQVPEKHRRGWDQPKTIQHAAVHPAGAVGPFSTRGASARYHKQRWQRSCPPLKKKKKWVLRSSVESRVAVPVGAHPGGWRPNPITERCFPSDVAADLRDQICPERMVPPGLAKDMENIAESYAVKDCCFQLALLQQMKSERDCLAVAGLDWGPTDESGMREQAGKVASTVHRAVEIWQINGDGLTLLHAVGKCPTKTVPKIRVLVVHIGKTAQGWMRHAMPMYHKPLADAIKTYVKRFQECADDLANEALQAILRDMGLPADVKQEGPQEPSQTERLAESAEPEPRTREVGVQAVDQHEWAWGCVEGLEVREPPSEPFEERPIRTRTATGIEESTQTSLQVVGSQCIGPCNKPLYVDGTPRGLLSYVAECHSTASHKKPFVDIFSPWSTDAIEPWGRSNLDIWLTSTFSTPDIALATLNRVKRYGLSTLYWFQAEAGRFDDDGRPDYLLQPGDVLGCDGTNWRFVPSGRRFCRYGGISVESYCLQVVPGTSRGLGLFASIKADVLPAFVHNPLSQAVVLEKGGALPTAVRDNILWRLEHGAEKDAATAVNLAHARNKAASGEDLPAVETARAIRQACRPYRGTLVGFGGTYGWGYCYSCGDTRPGKYEMRLCRECLAGKQSLLAQAIARGEQVCTDARFVDYPGLVERAKQHPPLKKSAETTQVDNDGQPALGDRIRVYGPTGKPVPMSALLGMVIPGRGPWLAGVGLDGAGPHITNGGTQPLAEAIMYRVFKKIDQNITPGIFDHAAGLARSDHLLGRFLRSNPTVMRIIEYIRSNPNPRRRKQLFQALLAWDERGEHSRDWEYISAFVKQENLPWFNPKNGVLNSAVREYVARLIQAPHDETHLVAGCYLKPLMRELKECWNKDNWIFYASTTPVKLNEWLGTIRHSRSYFWSDYTAFDATFSEGTWRMIEGFYHQIYPHRSADFDRVLEIWRKPRGRMRLRREGIRVEYDADVCNCSGRDDTALANALFNGIALSISFAAAIRCKRPMDVTPADLEFAQHFVRIAIVGDDSLVGCEFDVREYADQVVSNLKEFGLIVKAEHSQRLCDVTFLGMMPYRTRTGLSWGPTIGRRMYKMFWMKEFSAPAKWVRGVCQQGKLLKNVPLLNELCERVDHLLSGTSISREKVDGNRPWHYYEEEQEPWDEVTLHWLCDRYPGLSPAIIREDLRRIESITRLPAVIKLNSLEIILQTEEL